MAYRNLKLLVAHAHVPKCWMNVKLTRPGCEHNDSRSSGTEAWVNKIIIIIIIIIIIKGEQKGIRMVRYALKAATVYLQAMAQSRQNSLWDMAGLSH